jgi:LPS sulfotransferase NodH
MPSRLGFYFGYEVTPYVILFIERDGSTYLTSLLEVHPDVHAIYERFSVLVQRGTTAEEQVTWAESFLTPPLIGRYSAIGFKTKLVDVLDIEKFTKILHQKKCRIIHMQRRNRVKAVISKINARLLYESSGKWNLYQEADRMPPVMIDLEMFKRYLLEREKADDELEDYVNSLRLPKFRLIYEDLLLHKTKVLSDLFKFLNIRGRELEGKTLKHTKDDLREVILNFDDLRAAYRGSKYEQMFDEVLV